MLDRSRPSTAARLLAGATIVVLAVAGCGGSSSTPAASGAPAPAATPAPTAPPTAEPAATGGGAVTAGCADPATVAEALKNADHYIASAKINAALPGSSAMDLTLDMTMKYQKPDRIEVTSGMGGAATLFAMRQIGKESWISMLGSGTWSKSDSTTDEEPDVFSKLDSSGLTPLSEIPSDLVLPGSSSCVIGYSMDLSDATTGDASNPLSALAGASAFAMRVDTSTGLPESMGFQIDQKTAGEGAPTTMVFVFDYQTPVSIEPPDPSTVTEGGALPFPSGFELPSGLVLPSGMTLP